MEQLNNKMRVLYHSRILQINAYYTAMVKEKQRQTSNIICTLEQ